MELKECDLAFIRKCRVLCDDFPMELPGIKTLSACYREFVKYDVYEFFPWLIDAALEVFKEHAQNKHRMRLYVECLRRINCFLMDVHLQHFIDHIDNPAWEDEDDNSLRPLYAMFVSQHIIDPGKHSARILELARPHRLYNSAHLRLALENISVVFEEWFSEQGYGKKDRKIISTYNILARVGNIFDNMQED